MAAALKPERTSAFRPTSLQARLMPRVWGLHSENHALTRVHTAETSLTKGAVWHSCGPGLGFRSPVCSAWPHWTEGVLYSMPWHRDVLSTCCVRGTGAANMFYLPTAAGTQTTTTLIDQSIWAP